MRLATVLLVLLALLPSGRALGQDGAPADEPLELPPTERTEEPLRGVPVDDEVNPEVDPDALPPLTLSEEALEAGGDDEPESEEDAVIPPPPRPLPSEAELEAEEEERRATEEPDGEPTIIDDDIELVPDPPDLPEWRIRAGAGVALPTAGDFGVGLRLTQDVEWQPRGAEPFLFGLGGSESFGATVFGQAHARLGLHAWFCDERPVRCQAAVAAIVGAAFNATFADFDGAGEADLRFLFWDWLELHARGGFFTVQGTSLINITAGLAIGF